MQFKIDEKLANTVLQYLASRPYVEVFQLVEALKTLEKCTPEKKEKTEDKK